MVKEARETLAPQGAPPCIQAAQAERPDWPPKIPGVFADTVEEAEGGLSSCKPPPGSFPRDEPPTLNFRALLTEGAAERLELARA
jgi:hypothetical protein